jgi:hypothetical protein
MNTTTQGVDARAYLKGWAMALADMTSKDIRAIPEEKWTATYGGCTKPACEVTTDAVSLMLWVNEALKGNVIETDEPDARDRVASLCASREGAISALVQACRVFGAALTEASDEALNATITPPWKMPAPLYMLANIAVSHIWYHDGQLNYIQTLLGDDKVHWMEG